MSQVTFQLAAEVEEALKTLEANPLFSARKVSMDQRLAGLKPGPGAQGFGTAERHAWVIQRFEIRAEAFLALVADIKSQNAYSAVLRCLADASVYEYLGFRATGLLPPGNEAQRLGAFSELARKWTMFGYQRLAPDPVAAPESKDLDSNPQTRRNVVDAYVAEVLSTTGKRITRADIWRAAGYKTRAQFEHWEKNDDRSSVAADQRIRQVLREKPHLKKK